MRYLIRLAVLGDLDVLRDVYRRAALSNDGDRANLLANPECLEFSELAVTEGRTRVAVVANGPIAGFATWLVLPEAIEVDDLFVDPEWMRQGVGRELLLDLIDIARKRGVRRVEVTGNRHARGFYEKAGFVYRHDVETRFGSAPRMHLAVLP